MGKIDVKKLKSRLTLKDYENVMKALDIPLYMQGANSLIYWTGDKNKVATNGLPKLYLYKDTKIFVSYSASCSYDLIGLTQKRLNLLNKPSSFMDAVKFIMAIVGLEDIDVSRIHNNQHVYNWEDSLGKYVRFRRNGSALPIYDKAILDQLEHIYPLSWIEEGISIETMEKYGIGYYERTNSTTIPCFDKDGALIGIRVRNWQPEDLDAGRKYMPLMLYDNTIYKFPTNDIFYGINYNAPIIENKGHVILVEGEKSVLKADTFWGENSNVLALYGSQIGNKRRNDLIKMGVNHVTLALDSDFHKIGDDDYKNFEDKIIKLGSLFKGYAEVDVVYNNIGLANAYKASPFDFDEESFNKMWDNREYL